MEGMVKSLDEKTARNDYGNGGQIIEV